MSMNVISHKGRKILSDKKITARELEVIETLFNSGTQKEMAAKLFITERSIKQHFTNINKKLGATSMHDVWRVIVSLGCIEVETIIKHYILISKTDELHLPMGERI